MTAERGWRAALRRLARNPRRRMAGAPSDAMRRQAVVISRRIGQLGPLLDCVP